MRQYLTIAALIFASVVAEIGLASAPQKLELKTEVIGKELASCDVIQLLSLEPKQYVKGESDKDVKVFHGHRVLGTYAPSDEKLKQVLNGLRDSLSDDRDIRALCFRPHHGIVAMKDGKTLCEMLICYECQSAEVYDGEKYRGVISIKKGFEKQLNKLLAENKIPTID